MKFNFLISLLFFLFLINFVSSATCVGSVIQTECSVFNGDQSGCENHYVVQGDPKQCSYSEGICSTGDICTLATFDPFNEIGRAHV